MSAFPPPRPGPSATGRVPLPVDPDVPVRLAVARHASHIVRDRWDILAVIAAGGAAGSAARYGTGLLLPHDAAQFPWSTFGVNIVGSVLLGLLMVFVNDVWPPHRYVRPFLGVGVLGGFTTFSTYMLDTRALVVTGHPAAAALYLGATLLVGLLAVWLGIAGGRLVAARLGRRARTRRRS